VVAGAHGHGDGAVVLLHGWPGWTPDVVAGAIDRLRAEGAEFVTVDELDELPSDG
jgi:peptidoglycan/xylan/chitin deacetylase (PgdA/CDA1 family)